MFDVMASLQKLGRTLMLPIAVLPVAAILLRIGQPDLLNIAFIATAGDAIFVNLGMLFALGIAVGFAKENHGAAGLAGLVGYLVALHGVQSLVSVPPEILADISEKLQSLVASNYKISQVKALRVPIGIVSGIVAGLLYNKYNAIKLPEFLSFFGGRRFVPIAAGICGIGVAAVFGYGFPYISSGLESFSQIVVNAGGVGLFVFGVLNRILIVTGLHHILNNVAWFIVGDYNGVTGDLNRFFAGDPSAGVFMAGFFPVMMFGLPAACFAMYRSAMPHRRKEVAGVYLSLGLTSLLTGVTEPIEFTFMFLAPVLYALHAVLTGVSMALMDFLQIRLGFGFSAGLFDFVLNFNKATKPLWLFPIGTMYAFIYYFSFRLFIVKLNIPLLGREKKDPLSDEAVILSRNFSKAQAYIDALGGAKNLLEVAACTTRLRLIVEDNKSIDEVKLKSIGAMGFVRPSVTSLQVIVGAMAEILADEIKQELRSAYVGSSQGGRDKVGGGNDGDNDGDNDKALKSDSNISNNDIHHKENLNNSSMDFDIATVKQIFKALGGSANIIKVNCVSSRLILHVKSDKKISESKLRENGARGFVKIGKGVCHLLIGPYAAKMNNEINNLLSKSVSG